MLPLMYGHSLRVNIIYPEGIRSFRVARNELSWAAVLKFINPERVQSVPAFMNFLDQTAILCPIAHGWVTVSKLTSISRGKGRL